MSTKTDGKFVVSLEELLEAGCHFGHQARRWHPKMGEYIWNERDGVHIIDLEKTQKQLALACEKVLELTQQGKILVMVGTKRQASTVIEEEALRAGIPYVSKRWLGGTITNWKQLKRSIDRLKDLESKKTTGDLDHYTKKERVLFDKEIFHLKREIGGLRNIETAPDALFVVDVKREEAAVREAKKMGVPVIAIIDSNCDPRMADVAVPANDDALRSIQLITKKIADAVIEGKSKKQEAMNNEPKTT